MATEKQLAANRLNAQKSTGPVTAEGKARSALNALETGIYAETLLLPEEKPEDLRKLIAEYYLCYTPWTPATRNAIDNLIRAEWFARRFARIDTQILAHEVKNLSRPDPGNTSGQAFELCRVSMQKVQQRITATDNLYHRNLRVLQLLQPEQPVEVPDAEPVLEPAPEPTDPSLDLPTAQTTETKPETPKMASIPKTTPPTPDPQPLTPVFPTPVVPGHPVDFRNCPNCRTLGYQSPACHYDMRRAS